MAEGPYCDFPPGMDPSLMQQLANFQGRSSSENLDVGGKGPGFYVEYPTGMPTTSMEQMAMETMMGLSGGQGHTQSRDQDMGALANQSAAAGLYNHQMNYPMKTERGLPPTPPGSPDDGKRLRGLQNDMQMDPNVDLSPTAMSNMAASQQHLLAKPVPMRRLSEKRIAQARACLSTASNSMVPEQRMIDHSAVASSSMGTSPALARALATVQQTQKRPRSEKKAIPEEQKDNKYFERRKRNNHAAKKSRDARKAREDEIAIRASFLEKENAILRAQVATLREEANSLRQLLLQKRSRN